MNEKKHLTLTEVLLFFIVMIIMFGTGYIVCQNRIKNITKNTDVQNQNVQPVNQDSVEKKII